MKEKHFWTEDEIKELKEKWNKVPIYKLAKYFHVGTEEIIRKSKELNLEEYKSSRWTKEEENLLREYADKYLTEEIATKLGRSYLAVQKKANKLGIILHSENDPWEDWMIEYVKENINKIPIGKISEHIGLSYRRILTKCEHLGIEYIPESWTEEEIEILREYAPKCHYTELTKVLPRRTVGAISAKAYELGIETISEYHKLNEEIAEYVGSNWGIIPASEMARTLKVSQSVINRYKAIMNLPNLKSKRKWNENNIQKLKKDAEKMTRQELAKKYQSSIRQISYLAKKYNFKLIDTKKIWNDELDKKLVHLVEQKLSIPEIASKLNIKASTIRVRIKKLGLSDNKPKNPNIIWSEEETEQLIELSETKNSMEIATILNKTERQVLTKAKALNIKLRREHTRKTWTTDDINKLMDIYDKYDLHIVAKMLNRSEQSVSKKIDELELPKKYKKRTKWTQEEEQQLIGLLDTHSIREIANILNRTHSSVASKLKYIKKEALTSARYWTQEEEQQLIYLSEKYSVEEISRILHRTNSAITNKLTKLGIKTKDINWNPWTEEEEKMLIELANKMDTFEIAKKINRSEESVRVKAKQLGICLLKKRQWTPEEEEILTDLWGNTSIERIAKKLNRTEQAIINKVFLLGIGDQIRNNYKGVTIADLTNIFGVSRNTIMITWINLGLKIHRQKRSTYSSYIYVTIEDLFEFLENNQEFWDSRLLEKNIFGMEPEWLLEKRKNDMLFPTNYYKNVSLNKQQLLKENNYYLDEEAPKQKIKKKNEGENNV